MYLFYYLTIVILLVLCFRRDVSEGMLGIFSPLSNSEMDYDPSRWNTTGIQEYNNCYAYAMNKMEWGRKRKPHPGHENNIETTRNDFTCDKMNEYLMKDYPGVYKTDFDTPCKCNYYKAYLAVDPKNDFHLYRQDSDGHWSHKPGSLKVTNLDASKRVIVNPEHADKNYKKYNYNDSCMFFCVPSEKSCV